MPRYGGRLRSGSSSLGSSVASPFLSQCDELLKPLLLSLCNKFVIFRVMEIVIYEYLMCPSIIWVIKLYVVSPSYFLLFVRFVEFIDGQSFSCKFIAQPNIISDNIVKIHKYAWQKML